MITQSRTALSCRVVYNNSNNNNLSKYFLIVWTAGDVIHSLDRVGQGETEIRGFSLQMISGGGNGKGDN